MIRSINAEVLDVMTATIVNDWEVTPGYAREVARQLVENLEEKGIYLTVRRPPLWRRVLAGLLE